jgi:aminopeptidase N
MRITACLRTLTVTAAAALFPSGWAAEPGPDGRIVLPDSVVPIHYDISIEPDAKELTFKGSAAVEVAVRVPTDTITLNSADIVIEQAGLSGLAAQPEISYDEKVQTATFTFPQPLSPGTYTLSLRYRGRIYQASAGLFALDYDSPGGKKRALFTQFENSDARRFVPCWDEPALKATFTLTAVVPAGLMALSNMPIAGSEALPGGLQRVSFAESPKMSSYLLFFGLGDLERVHRNVDGVDVGVVVKRGETASAQFALDAASEILPYYNDYFGTRYPLPKLDLIAGPGLSAFFSAMENWGAIFYFESVLLFDPKTSTELDKSRIHTVIAHEMSHQWFGDLVTMEWWDELWLNEGFASWMERKATDHFHPEWKIWLDSIARKQDTMQTDARDGTHPVITPIKDVLQASGAFDGITYIKGQSIIRMLEAYVGEDAFRGGVRRYMRDHAYGNTTTDDLWREIDSVSERKLTGIAHDFTLQPGVPLLTVSPSDGGIRLAEERFALDSSGAAGGAWRIPVIIQPPVGAARRIVVSAGEPTLLTDVPPGSVVNAGQTGYFRVLYRDRALTALGSRFGSLTADDQIGILADASTFGNAGRAPMADFLALSARLPADADPAVWTSLATRLARLDLIYDGLPTQKAFRAFASGLLAPAFKRVGFDATAGESDNTAIMRSTLLTELGQFNDTFVVNEARRRFAIYLGDPSSLKGSGRTSVLTVVAINADLSAWDQLHSLARGASSSLEKQRYYVYLGLAQDPVLARKALDLALTEEAQMTVRPRIISSVAERHPEAAFDFAVAHLDVLTRMVEEHALAGFTVNLLSTASETQVLDRLNSFAEAHVVASQMQYVRKAVALVRYDASIRVSRLPEIDAWLASGR